MGPVPDRVIGVTCTITCRSNRAAVPICPVAVRELSPQIYPFAARIGSEKGRVVLGGKQVALRRWSQGNEALPLA